MTTAYVATLGGHISELVELADRIVDVDTDVERDGADEPVWITNDSPQTRDLLRGRRVEMVPFVAERDVRGVVRGVATARRLLARYGVERVVSTGSALALSYLPLAATRGLEAHYIESSTRVTSCSVTGRLLSRTPGVRCWWQYEEAPTGFRPLGSVYDRYRVTDDGPRPGPTRIVVTVGTTDRDFCRLVERLVTVIPPGAEVLWQTGHSDVSRLGIDGRPLVPESELVAAIERADVVVSHAGAGSLALALRAGKVPVYVPRRARFGEQIDDHQVELARWAAARGLAVHAEADRITPDDLAIAAGRRVTIESPGELVLQ